ncbi:MAG: RES family NAD+ phosphorylase [Thiohalocapsa sp.]
MTIPPPPVGGHHKVRLVRLPAGQVWYRISHRRHGSALYFSRGPDARWNHPNGDYGVLYVADRPETAFAETFGHGLMNNLPPTADKFVTQVELQERHLHRIRSEHELTLALFCAPGLPALNMDARLLATLDYDLPQAWARWALEAPAAPHGIRYTSRALPGSGINTALFDRCRGALTEEDLGPLDSWRSDTEDLDLFDILDAQGWGLA